MTKITIEVEFSIGEVVFVLTDVDQTPRVVSGYSIVQHNRSFGVLYNLSCNGEETSFYEFEITNEKTIF
jgi:hypothetical protein